MIFDVSKFAACLPNVNQTATVPGNVEVSSCVTCIRTWNKEVHVLTSDPVSENIDVVLHLYQKKVNLTLVLVSRKDASWKIISAHQDDIHVEKIILVSGKNSSQVDYPISNGIKRPSVLRIGVSETAKDELMAALGSLGFVTSSSIVPATSRWDLWVGLSTVCAPSKSSSPSALTSEETIIIAVVVPVAAFVIGAIITAAVLCRPP